MRSYRICSKLVELGTYEGATPADALSALARDAGYDDYAASLEIAGGGEDLKVVEVDIEG